MSHHLITLMVLLPFAGALLQAFMPKLPASQAVRISKWAALGCSLLASLCGIALILSMQTQAAELQMSESLPWVGSYAISYEMGVDGLNALMVLLVAILIPVLIAAEWDQKLAPKGMHALFLLLQSAFFGVVCAQDIFLQFFFWAFSALPFYFLIGIWGGKERESAAFRSVVAASMGNALIFGALILVYYSVDPHTFLLRDLAGGKLNGKTFEFMGYMISVPGAAFALISAGLAFRAPIWPLHGWFTRVTEEAPPSVLVALSGITVPLAAYLFVRLGYSLFPETLVTAAPWIVGAGAVNLLMGGICAIAQRGLRPMLAFLCLGQVGMLLVGIGSMNPAGLVGAVYQGLTLGIGLAGFGLFMGLVIERSGHAAFLTEGPKPDRPFGGIATQAPAVAMVAGIVVASLLGFPGLGGFVGSALVLIGSYSVQPVVVILAGIALLMAAYYLFMMYRYVFLGKAGESSKDFTDLTLRERAYLLPLVLGLLAFGTYPKPLLDLVRPTVLTLLSTVK